MPDPADDPVRTVRLCLLGFGNVARRFCEVVADRQAELAQDHGVRYLVTAVGTARHGSLLAPDGLAVEDLLAQAPQVSGWSFPDPARPGAELVAASGAEVLVESTPAEHHGAPVAIGHLEAAFEHGLDVVTVNKGPIAWDYRRLRALAHERGCRLRHEGITMDGCPVYNLAEFCLPGAHVTGFRGVLNSTTNYVLDAMANGVTFAQALQVAVDEGFAEADPSHDIDGHDGALKVAALANVLMDADITPDDVPRDSIADLTPGDVEPLQGDGRRLRVVCEATWEGDELVTGVTLTAIEPSDPFWGVTGSSSMLVLQTDLMGDIEITERDGLLTQTAYAVYADLLTLHRRRDERA